MYRFIDPQKKKNNQRIVYKNNLDAFLSAISWIVTHGNSDNDKDFNQLNEKASTGKVFITCRNISAWAKSLLDGIGIKSRLIVSFALNSRNSYDSGHNLIEIYRKEYDKWVLYDLDSNIFFWGKEEPLSLFEFHEKLWKGEFEIKYLANDVNLDISNFFEKDSGYDLSLYMEDSIFSGEDKLKDWYRRIMGISMINDSGKIYSFEKINMEKKNKSNVVFLEKKDFVRKFYENTNY